MKKIKPVSRSNRVIFYLIIVAVFLLFCLRNRDAPSHAPKRDLLDMIDVNCDAIKSGKSGYSRVQQSRWRFNSDELERKLMFSADRCRFIRETFTFATSPRSSEEAEYPLAYGILAYRSIVQLLFMLSAFYEPQNEYCIATGNNSEIIFNLMLKEVADCFHNVHFIQRGNIHWGSYEIINSTYSCLQYLSALPTPWQYYQYLSGFDVPLKTNLEMVRIFKWLNGSVNVQLNDFEKVRLIRNKIHAAPLPLFKSSLSALIPRSTADAIVASAVTSELLRFLSSTYIADETFWGTLTGNRRSFPIPGSFDAGPILNLVNDNVDISKNWTLGTNDYYISRYQVWSGRGCHGKMVSGSCCYGVGDVADLLSPKQRAPVGHKFYLDYQPAGYFCVLKELRRRSRIGYVHLNKNYYRQLPLVELNEGVQLQNISHPDWLL